MNSSLYLIPRLGASSQSDWYPWLKQNVMEEYHNSINIAELPNWDQPNIEETSRYLKSFVTNLNEQTIIIAHSIGCQATLRFLDQQFKQNPHLSIYGILFVAGWFRVDQPWPFLKPWLDTSTINFHDLSNRIRHKHLILSDNDPFTRDAELNKNEWLYRLDIKVDIYKNRSHFNATQEHDVYQTLSSYLKHHPVNHYDE